MLQIAGATTALLIMSKLKILWADDDADDLAIMREVLRSMEHDFEIIEVQNGKEVLDYLKRTTENSGFPCLIILDMNMPVLNGRETLVILKSSPEYKEIPVVVFTTSSSEMDRLFCKRYHTEMFTKPPVYSEFNRIVHDLLSFCVQQRND